MVAVRRTEKDNAETRRALRFAEGRQRHEDYRKKLTQRAQRGSTEVTEVTGRKIGADVRSMGRANLKCGSECESNADGAACGVR